MAGELEDIRARPEVIADEHRRLTRARRAVEQAVNLLDEPNDTL
jgi:hypothetical protein